MVAARGGASPSAMKLLINSPCSEPSRLRSSRRQSPAEIAAQVLSSSRSRSQAVPLPAPARARIQSFLTHCEVKGQRSETATAVRSGRKNRDEE